MHVPSKAGLEAASSSLLGVGSAATIGYDSDSGISYCQKIALKLHIDSTLEPASEASLISVSRSCKAVDRPDAKNKC